MGGKGCSYNNGVCKTQGGAGLDKGDSLLFSVRADASSSTLVVRLKDKTSTSKDSSGCAKSLAADPMLFVRRHHRKGQDRVVRVRRRAIKHAARRQ